MLSLIEIAHYRACDVTNVNLSPHLFNINNCWLPSTEKYHNIFLNYNFVHTWLVSNHKEIILNCCEIFLIWFCQSRVYTTKGRDRFHWAAILLKPYRIGNICYMTYNCSVLFFLNLSLKHFLPKENGNFCENIQIRRPLSFHVLTCRACLIDVLPNLRKKTL